jgi:hypothetical protein
VMPRLQTVTWALLALLIGAPGARAQNPNEVIGRIKLLTGTASVVRGDQVVAAAVGGEIHRADVLRTGADGQIGVTLQDETRISLGPGTEVSVSAFEFAPAESRYQLGLRLLRGVLSYISGRIAKMAPERVHLETPSLVIGVRGTHALIKVER